MLLRYAILSLLAEEEMHGYRIKTAFEERMGSVWIINFGQIYGTLKDLTRRELITGRLETNGGHMGRRVYSATAKGRRALNTWLARKPRVPAPVRNEIFIRLLGAAHGEVDVSLTQLERQAEVYRASLAELQLRRAGLRAAAADMAHRDALAWLAVDATMLQIDAHLRWLDRCGKELRRRAGSAERESA